MTQMKMMEFQVVSLASSIHLRLLRLIPLRSVLPSQLASFGERSPARGANGFGTQHIITGQWVRLGSRFAGEVASLCDPFSRACQWVRLGKRSLASFGESPLPRASTLFGTQHIITGQWVRLGSRFAGDLAHFLDASSRDSHWLRFVIRSLASFGEYLR
jgi:hypothetical protein